MLAYPMPYVQITQRRAKLGTRPLRPSSTQRRPYMLFISSILILALACGGIPAEEPRKHPIAMALFDFNSADEASWQVVNDGVMGGRSQGYVAIEEGMLRFTGTLVTQGGGFTSVRADRSVDLEGYDGLELRVRGGGRTFEVEVDDDTRRRGRTVSRRAPFETDAEWSLVRVPFSDLRTTIFGQPVSAPPIDLANVKRIGLYILDGKDGPFRLEVDTIRAYRADAD
jgi:NADH dehydrogenase [ubiquinone] 1 alpha subcomplex assembly factor 1